MPLSIGIVGLPNVGKSTLFRAITKKKADCANYPFCTIDPNVGIVAVPDERADRLAETSGSGKTVYSVVEFVDIAGLVEGASKGEGLGNRFLANIREADAVVYVLRCFRNEKIINTRGKIDVLGDKEILDAEMALKDIQTIEKRIRGLEKEAKSGSRSAAAEMEILSKARGLLENGKILSDCRWSEKEKKALANYQLLTLKKRICLLNGKKEEVPPGALETFKKNGWPFVIVDALSELEAAGLSREEREELGLAGAPQLDKLIRKSYDLLGLITFFTTGPDETRAWTLKKGETAPKAGGAIHSDFEKNFIKAEVVGWKDLVEAGGFSKAKEKGMVRTEGKNYVVKDGDVILIKSGVKGRTP